MLRLLTYIGILFFQATITFSTYAAEYINSRYGYKFSLPDSTCVKKEASRLVKIYKDKSHMNYVMCISGVFDTDIPDEFSHQGLIKEFNEMVENLAFGTSQIVRIEEITVNDNPTIRYLYKTTYSENVDEQYKEMIKERFTVDFSQKLLDEYLPKIGVITSIGIESIHAGLKYGIACETTEENLQTFSHLINKILDSFSYIPVGNYLTDDISSISCRAEDVFEMPEIPKKDYTEEEIKMIRYTVNNLQNNDKKCINDYINEYQINSYKYCIQTGILDDRAGGCAHGVRSPSIEEIAIGLEECNINISQHNQSLKSGTPESGAP